MSEKRVLGIDTSSMSLNLALVGEGGFVVSSHQETSKNHASRIPSAIDNVLKPAALEIKDVSAIAVAAGPGSFTGLRVGLSVALAFRSALKIPIYPFSTLFLLAGISETEGKGVVLTDARKSEFYFQLFEKKAGALTELTEPRTIPHSGLSHAVEGSQWIIAMNLKEVIKKPPRNLAFVEHPNLAVQAAKHALLRMASGEKGAETVTPLYVRPPDAIPQVRQI